MDNTKLNGRSSMFKCKNAIMYSSIIILQILRMLNYFCVSDEYLEPIDQDSGSSQMVLKVARCKSNESLQDSSGIF